MIEVTYHPEADAAYIYLSRGCEIESTEEVAHSSATLIPKAGIGIEILEASKVLAPVIGGPGSGFSALDHVSALS